MNGVVLHAHPVRGESYNQSNTTGEVATVLSVILFYIYIVILILHSSLNYATYIVCRVSRPDVVAKDDSDFCFRLCREM